MLFTHRLLVHLMLQLLHMRSSHSLHLHKRPLAVSDVPMCMQEGHYVEHICQRLFCVRAATCTPSLSCLSAVSLDTDSRRCSNPNTCFVGTLQIVLARYCRQDDVVVGTPTNGRHMPELQQMVGNLVNMLPIRTQISAETSFKDVLAAVRDAYLGALEHENLPFNKIVELLGIQRAPNRTPLFQAIVAVNEQQGGGDEVMAEFSPVPEEQVSRLCSNA